MKFFLPLIVFFIFSTHFLHLYLNKIKFSPYQEKPEILLSTNTLYFLSLGYKNLVADYYWIRVINHFGDIRSHKSNYPMLKPLMERVLTLDPYFISAYKFAGTAMTLNGMDISVSNRFLEKGLKYRPHVWDIPFFLGFNRYHFLNDYLGASKVFSLAAHLPDAPTLIGSLATRLAVEARKPEIGISMIDILLKNTKDTELVKFYKKRRKLLILELNLNYISNGLDQYETIHGKRAKNLEEFLSYFKTKKLPDEPLGGKYYIDSNFNIATTSEKERLKLYKKP